MAVQIRYSFRIFSVQVRMTARSANRSPVIFPNRKKPDTRKKKGTATSRIPSRGHSVVWMDTTTKAIRTFIVSIPFNLAKDIVLKKVLPNNSLSDKTFIKSELSPYFRRNSIRRFW